MFRGREITYVEQGYKMMRQLAEMVQDIAVVESPAKLEGKKLIMVLAPGQAKKGAAKPVSGPVPRASGPIPNPGTAAPAAAPEGATAPAADANPETKKPE